MSRKIDALVAEKVMGWKREVQDRTIVGYRDGGGKFHIISGLQGVSNCWNPSTDIAAAWEVVEKMRLMGITVFIGIPGRDDEVGTSFTKRDDVTDEAEEVGSSSAPTAPLAISLAALRAVGVPESEIEEATNG